MAGLVIDASIALAWCFEDEASPEGDAVLDRVRAEGAFAPALWTLEIANTLLHAERRGRMKSADLAASLDLLRLLPIDIDHESSARAWTDILPLARREGLTTYDATYLDLALRRGLPLATRDGDLAAAARRLGVLVA